MLCIAKTFYSVADKTNLNLCNILSLFIERSFSPSFPEENINLYQLLHVHIVISL